MPPSISSNALKLDGMAQAFVELEAQEEAGNLAHAEWLALLLDREAASRNTKRFQTRVPPGYWTGPTNPSQSRGGKADPCASCHRYRPV